MKELEQPGNNSTALDALDVARFWRKVDVQDTARCWPWTSALKAAGYGEFRTPDGKQPAHRIAYQLAVGVIPDGLVVRHKCDNPACCNPTHLETGTHADNVRDRVIRGRSAIGEDAGRAILTEADVYRIRAASQDEWRALSVELNVDKATIRAAAIGLSWKHLLPEAPPIEGALTLEQLLRSELVPIPVAALALRCGLKRLRGYVHRNTVKHDDPIGSLATDEVYGWSCRSVTSSTSSAVTP